MCQIFYILEHSAASTILTRYKEICIHIITRVPVGPWGGGVYFISATRNKVDLFSIKVLEIISTLVNRTHVSLPSKPVFLADLDGNSPSS